MYLKKVLFTIFLHIYNSLVSFFKAFLKVIQQERRLCIISYYCAKKHGFTVGWKRQKVDVSVKRKFLHMWELMCKKNLTQIETVIS